MIQIMQYPTAPDLIARKAGKTMYGTAVGSLRRNELYRLGNAWGAKFPVGATKDFMIPFFTQLESQGKDPFKPPYASPQTARHSELTHIERGDQDVMLGGEMVHSASSELSPAMAPQPDPIAPQSAPDVILPTPMGDFETKLNALPHGKLKKLCFERKIPQSNKDRKQELIARIVAASEAPDVKDVP